MSLCVQVYMCILMCVFMRVCACVCVCVCVCRGVGFVMGIWLSATPLPESVLGDVFNGDSGWCVKENINDNTHTHTHTPTHTHTREIIFGNELLPMTSAGC